ncbi:hypothetical protein [Halpernia sp.]|uniref:hypothetical protein n=1 Tax=Halpernia sp. TaxID=2782209 RepID=UPI003A9070E1
MEKQHALLIPREILLLMAIVGFLLTLFGALLKITHWSFGPLNTDIALSVGVIFSFITWFVVLIDLFRNKIQSKLIWIIGMFLMGSVISILYLIYRKNYVITK